MPSELEPEPAVLTGALVGYLRVSTRDQNLDRQTDALTAAGCLRIFADKRSGKTSARPELAKALGLHAAGGHPGRGQPGSSVPLVVGSHRYRRRAAPAGRRLPVALVEMLEACIAMHERLPTPKPARLHMPRA